MPIRRPLIILIDPDEKSRLAIQQALEERKFEVFVAANFEDGYSMVSRMHPALVVMDFNIPLQNKLNQLHKDIPVIGIPASGGGIKPMLEAGAIWAQDKFYIQQGLEANPRDAGTKEIAAEFLSAVHSVTQNVRKL